MFDMTEEDVIELIKGFEPDDKFETKLQYERIDISEEIDIDKTDLSRECMICHYWYFKDDGFRFKSDICNECSIGCTLLRPKRIEVLNVKGVDCRCVLSVIGRNKAINIPSNSVLEDKGIINLNNSMLEDRDVL